MRRTILFIDIDGVLSILDSVDEIEDRKISWPGGPHAWPIPMTRELLQAINEEKRLYPVWMSAWYDAALLWNFYARTRRLWPMGYTWHKATVQRVFPELGWVYGIRPTWDGQEIDSKLLAVRYFLRNDPCSPVTWIEDGFAPETRAWAAERGARLVNTLEPAIREVLRANYDQPRQAARQFIETYLLG
jgi:hypothetical protein